ncbi:19812_t:CDS:1, partial [Funneliformis geosporum]
GFKPSRGLISRYGLIPMASSLDTVGILTNSVVTTQKIFPMLAQPDSADLLTIAAKQTSVKSISFLTAKKIAILAEVEKYLSFGFAKLYQKTIDILKAKKYQIEIIKIPPEIREHLQLTYLIICSSELASHLNACQGITYGKKLNDISSPEKVGQKVCQVRTEYLGKSVRQRLLLGSYFLQNKKDCEQAYRFQQKVKN